MICSAGPVGLSLPAGIYAFCVPIIKQTTSKQAAVLINVKVTT